MKEVCTKGFPGGSVAKNPPINAGDARALGSIPGSERSPGETNDLEKSILQKIMDR